MINIPLNPQDSFDIFNIIKAGYKTYLNGVLITRPAIYGKKIKAYIAINDTPNNPREVSLIPFRKALDTLDSILNTTPITILNREDDINFTLKSLKLGNEYNIIISQPHVDMVIYQNEVRLTKEQRKTAYEEAIKLLKENKIHHTCEQLRAYAGFNNAMTTPQFIELYYPEYYRVLKHLKIQFDISDRKWVKYGFGALEQLSTFDIMKVRSIRIKALRSAFNNTTL